MTTLIYNSPGRGTITSVINACAKVDVHTVVAELGSLNFSNSIEVAKKRLDEKLKVLLVVEVNMPLTNILMHALHTSIENNYFAGHSLKGLSGVSVIVDKSEANNIPDDIKSKFTNIDAELLLKNPAQAGKSHLFSDTAMPNSQLGFMVLSDIDEMDNFIKRSLEKNKPAPGDLLGLPEPK